MQVTALETPRLPGAARSNALTETSDTNISSHQSLRREKSCLHFTTQLGNARKMKGFPLLHLLPQLGLCSTMDPSAGTVASNRHRGTLLGTAPGPEAFLRAQRWEICLSYNHRVVWVGRAL